MGSRFAQVLVSLVLALGVAVVMARAQDVFSTNTGGGAPLQGGVSITEPPAEPGRTRPTGTQGVKGNPDCPPPKLADGTTPKNWSCTTGGQGVVGNPDCPPPVFADGTTPKNWSCPTGTQGVEGNPNCPPLALPNGLVPRNWSCAGPDMHPDPLAPLRDPAIPVDYRGDPGVPPLMRVAASTDDEAAAGAVLTCRRAVVEGIERPSQAEMAEYVCDDQSKALEQPPFQLRVEQTVCILPLKGAVEELKAGKMLLLKADEASGAERARHAAEGNGHLLRAAIRVDQSDVCLVENPPRPRGPARRPPVDPRAAARDPCAPVAGMDPRLRGAIDANCPKAPPPRTPQSQPQAQPQPQPQPQPQSAQRPPEPRTDDPEGGCDVAQAPLDVRDQLMDLARQLDRNATELQNAALQASNRFLQGMNDVVQQQLLFLAQRPGEPAGQIVQSVVAYLTNDRNENHAKLLADAQKAVEEFANDPAYAAGKAVSNFLIGRAQGTLSERLPGGAKVCTAASRRATEETRKLRGAVQAAGELDKLAKEAEGAADGCKACRRTPSAAAEDQRFRAEVQRRQQADAARKAAEAARGKARPQRSQAAERQTAAQAERNQRFREQANLQRMDQADRQRMETQRMEAERQRIATQQRAVDERRAQQAQAMREQRRQTDERRRDEQRRMTAEAQGRRSPATPEEAAAQRQMQQAERQRQIEDARRQNEARRSQSAQRPTRQGAAVRREGGAGDTVRMRPGSGDTVPMKPEGGDTVQLPRDSGFGSDGQAAAGGAGALKPLSQQTTPVNPFGQNQNCLPSAVAADLRKKHPGRPYTDSDIRIASPDEATSSVEVMEILRKHYGRQEFAGHDAVRRRAQAMGIPAKVGSSAEIRDELLHGGPDSRGIVFVRNKATGSGHVVSAEVEGGQARYFDHQSGTDAAMWATISDIAPDAYEMFFYRTN